MQQVNALPTFVSQDADIKRNDSPSSQGTQKREKDFSSLVDQHIKKKKAIDRNDYRTERENNDRNNAKRRDAAKADNYADDKVAGNGNAIVNDKPKSQKPSTKEVNDNSKNEMDTDRSAERKEDKQTSTQVENQDTESQATQTDTKADKQQSEAANKDVAIAETADNEAMLASQKFISLLYNSDQALTDGKTVTSDTEVSTEDERGTKKEPQATTKSDVLAAESTKGSAQEKASNATTAEHKLKVFADEIGATKTNPSVNTDEVSDIDLLTNKDMLSRYQQQLQLKDQQVINKSVSSELKSTELQVNQHLLKEKTEGKLAPLPVEPSIEPVEEQLFSAEHELKKALAKSDEHETLAEQPKPKTKVENETSILSKSILAEKITEALVDENVSKGSKVNELSQAAQSVLNPTASQLTKQAFKQESEHNVTSEIKKGATTENIKASSVTPESIIDTEHREEQSPIIEQQKPLVPPTVSQATANTALKENINQASLAQRSQSSAELNATKGEVQAQSNGEYVDTADELALAETELSQLNEDDTVSSKPVNNKNSTDNIARAFIDINAQATQVKQASDAYSNYQNSEMLNHNVATDTAQIQKNNVQLHQETISIFRKDFSDAVKDKVMLTINQKLQQFDITLDPPEFGNMQVRVNLQGEQASVNFVVQNQQAKDALEQNMDKLKDMLAEQGVDVDGAHVEQQNQNNAQGDAQSEQQGSTASALKDGAEKDNELRVLSGNLFNSSATGVDYYA